MRKLRLLIIGFCLALSLPLGYVVLQSYAGMRQEESAKLKYFAETLFDAIEDALTALVVAEESRTVDEYNYYAAAPGQRSPLSYPPQAPYIFGYLQNNPDGSFQTPLAPSPGEAPSNLAAYLRELEAINAIFNHRRFAVNGPAAGKTPPAPAAIVQAPREAAGYAEPYLTRARSQAAKSVLGQQEKRTEAITVDQALKITRQESGSLLARENHGPRSRSTGQSPIKTEQSPHDVFLDKNQTAVADGIPPGVPPAAEADFQVEVAPLQSVFIDDRQVFLFRRIAIDNQIYRQGLVLQTRAFLQDLIDRHFSEQPMARFARLELSLLDRQRTVGTVHAGAAVAHPAFHLQRTFPAPFAFVRATLACDRIPPSAGRRVLNLMLFIFTGIMLLGLFAIYRSARTAVDLSERRARFVSSVTHELKTPLTNIRMYIEMLEQSIARDPEREQDYFRILSSESARLSRLIGNVLELSRLEKKQRPLNMHPGTFEEVVAEVEAVMNPKLRQEGFTFKVRGEAGAPFRYDREVMIQVLINLIENSLKFGRNAPIKEIELRLARSGGRVHINIADTGPGIPRSALKKVFDDFYRVEGPLRRSTSGTGIGLALVKKFVSAMGGTVSAANNTGAGCTITVSLPA